MLDPNVNTTCFRLGDMAIIPPAEKKPEELEDNTVKITIIEIEPGNIPMDCQYHPF